MTHEWLRYLSGFSPVERRDWELATGTKFPVTLHIRPACWNVPRAKAKRVERAKDVRPFDLAKAKVA